MLCLVSVILASEIKVEKENILATSSELPFYVSSHPALPKARLLSGRAGAVCPSSIMFPEQQLRTLCQRGFQESYFCLGWLRGSILGVALQGRVSMNLVRQLDLLGTWQERLRVQEPRSRERGSRLGQRSFQVII